MRLPLAIVLLALVLTACGARPIPTATPETTTRGAPRVVPAADVAQSISADIAASGPKVVSLFAIPVRGVLLPTAPELLPNSRRDYRAGVHEGIDFSEKVGTPVYSAAPGKVSRVDYAYEEWSEPARNAALDNARRLGYTPELVLDLIRGRQVWVDHGDGVVTRYAHLSSVSPLQRGDAVDPSIVIGYVGSSGLPEGGPHLHFEIRIGDSYLGYGFDATSIKAEVANAFAR